MTKLKVLLKSSNSLFHKLFVDEKLDTSKELFIDRPPTLFVYILDYLRTGEVNKKRLKLKEMYKTFKKEVEYYGISELTKKKNKIEDLKFTQLEVSGYYNNSTAYGSNPRVLHDKNLNTAILTAGSGQDFIIIHFNKEVTFRKMSIGGFTGDSQWSNTNGWGTGAIIFSSKDKNDWKQIGVIPSGFGGGIIEFNVTSNTAMYLKFQHSSWMAIGYVGILY